ncbi:MAG: DUF3575 domain-containing protein [Flavobacteriales bacterium]|nr:DUF3575 domain-containing protein [Flavobacteriales bacterium]
MKRSLALIFSLLFALSSTAQIRVAKVNVASAAFGTASFSFEKVRDKQFSWQLTATYRPRISGPNMAFNNLETGWELSRSEAQVIGGQLAYRFYTRKGRTQPTKPYIAGYFQHHIWDASVTHQFDGTSYTAEGKWTQSVLGLQYGVQWVVNDAWSIDLTLVGFGLAFGQVSGTATTGPEPNIGFWEENLGFIPWVGNHINIVGSESPYTFKADYTSIGIHSALRLGILF